MATFPATLPNPQVSGFQVSPLDQTARTEMESGAARSRRRSAARNDQVAVVWQFTDDEMATFRAWFDADEAADGAAAGAAWFDISLPVGDGGLDAVEARFIGPFRAGMPSNLIWSVSATLEVR